MILMFGSVDFEGKLADVVLGFDSLEPYLVKFCKLIWFSHVMAIS